MWVAFELRAIRLPNLFFWLVVMYLFFLNPNIFILFIFLVGEVVLCLYLGIPFRHNRIFTKFGVSSCCFIFLYYVFLLMAVQLGNAYGYVENVYESLFRK